ncbi:ABC-type transport auxiliary lipoprotein family protein [Qipengyuania atrilutea]|uniref:Membrane integrity-associated transporter subunit PqiC n=1 Tax=Qipengyuania atrilutea TaxID=2744473 RepID=A0A850H4A4_9SPHN|nr:ABC-type transport auxiliary lipoprotein family protein [Actirhodobacter atriluteus]NVD45430.1 membrane integrity-associated transporter subunit PqiC [Actirhodobacter atriluteus]
MTRIFRKAFWLAPAALLAGCVSFGPDVPESLLTLTSEVSAPVGNPVAATEANSIAVYELAAPARLAQTRVPVQIDPSSIAYLKDAVWVERPARLFRRLLGETLRARGGLVVADDDEAALTATNSLAGTIVDFGYDAPSSSVVVRFDAVRKREGLPPETRRFESIVPGVLPEANPVGVALNQAANDVARQVADWAR